MSHNCFELQTVDQATCARLERRQQTDDAPLGCIRNVRHKKDANNLMIVKESTCPKPVLHVIKSSIQGLLSSLHASLCSTQLKSTVPNVIICALMYRSFTKQSTKWRHFVSWRCQVHQPEGLIC